MINKFKDDNGFKIYKYYTLVFAIAAVIIFSPFIISGKSFILYTPPSVTGISYVMTDGLTQHYVFFAYIGIWLRSVIRAILTLHLRDIPVFSFSLGFGDDIFAALHYYGIFNIFNLPAVLFGGDLTELGFNLTFIMQLYLAGIFFIHYCLYNNRTRLYSVITGALIYCFSLYTLYYATRQFSIFTMPLLYLPLLLNAVDILLKEGKAARLAVTAMLAACANIYIMFMLGIFTGIYFIFRLIELHRKTPLVMLKLSLTALAAVICGMLIAMPSYLDLVTRAIGGNRLDTTINIEPLLYSSNYYTSFIHDIVSYNTGMRENLNFIGVTAVGLLCIVILFMRKGNTGLKLGFILLTLFELTPVVPYMFNLCSHKDDRIVWAYIMLIAYICVVALPELESLIKSVAARLKLKVKSEVIIYALLCALLIFALYDIFIIRPLVPVIAIGIAIVFYIIYRCRLKYQRLIISTVIALLCVNSFRLYYIDMCYIDSFTGFVGNTYNSEATDSTYRYDSYLNKFNLFNDSLLSNRLGTNYYLSFADSFTTDLKDSIALPFNIEQYNINLDNRAFVQALLGVKYVTSDKDRLSPYLKPVSDTEEQNTILYENTMSLPLIIGYDDTMSEDYLDSLKPIYRQEAMLQYAAVANGSDNKPTTTATRIDYTTSTNDDKTTLKFTPQADCELYLSCSSNGGGIVTVSCGDSVQRLELCDPTIYKTRDYTMINLGYFTDTVSEVELNTKGSIIDNLELYSQPLDKLLEYTSRLTSGIDSTIERKTNEISGTLTLDKAKLVCFTLPYRDSARLYINGQLYPTQLCNKMFIGASLPEGEYSYRLVYTLPNKGVKLAALSVGIVILVLLRRIGNKNVL